MSHFTLNRTHALCMVLVSVVCFCLFGLQAKLLAELLWAEGWPTVQGRVSESKVLRTCHQGKPYVPMVIYSYEYQGQGYRGSRITFNDPGCVRDGQAQKIVSPYPRGAVVTVWVNPNAPSESALVVGVSGEEKLMPFLVLAVGLFSLWLARNTWHLSSAA